ncbi:PAC2 family-domain-containing protein [Halteromyces radiatus]|uniref:PAC2 family-domain-containing protein n=1 Tax=Halteromyces radiatus TaxID=101107 RepID=UPI00221E8469|nr:PAC2 family-domain-containing protein [Halteromyces radiatus]KAI8082974.1 PAC2 family-domain-containing protein [Halteromyces radiatus]
MTSSFIPSASYDISLLKDSQLLLPSVSIGNVPQLTCDLIIHTLHLKRVGFISSDAVIPVVGQYEDQQAIGISVPIEVYQSKDRRWTVIQQRSPTLKGKKQSLISTLITFIASAGFSQVVILTSLDAARRLDSQISGIPFRVVGDVNTVQDIYQTIQVPNLEMPPTEQQQKEDIDMTSTLPPMPGAGIARSLYQQLQEKKTKVIMFCMFVLEGDNVQDSVELANLLNTYYHIKSKDTDINNSGAWTPPKSWECLFGTPFNAEIYQ